LFIVGFIKSKPEIGDVVCGMSPFNRIPRPFSPFRAIVREYLELDDDMVVLEVIDSKTTLAVPWKTLKRVNEEIMQVSLFRNYLCTVFKHLFSHLPLKT